MRETWLRTNRRVLSLGMILPIVFIAVGLIAILAMPTDLAWIRYAGWIAAAAGVLLLGLIGVQFRIPRLAYAQGRLLVYLAGGGPCELPIEVVQCFFLGSGSGQIPGPKGNKIGVRNLTVRLDEKATEYHRRDVNPDLGRWSDGYIVIHGAWCEPLDLALVQRLNQQLAQAQAEWTRQEQQTGQSIADV